MKGLARIFVFCIVCIVCIGQAQTLEEFGAVDAVIVAGAVTCVLEHTVRGLQTFARPGIRNVHIIVPSHVVDQCRDQTAKFRDVNCIDEADVLELNPPIIEDLLTAKWHDFKSQRAPWYLQQLLKLLAVVHIPDLTEHYLVWDADVVLVKEYNLYLDGKMRVNIGGWLGHHYDITTTALLNVEAPRQDLVTHQMLVDREEMLNMLRHICDKEWSATEGSRASRCGYSILDQIPARAQPYLGLSEYHLYYAWAFSRIPSKLRVDTARRFVRTSPVHKRQGTVQDCRQIHSNLPAKYYMLVLETLSSPSSGSVRIFHVHRVDKRNIGDMLASPLNFFPELKNATTTVFDVGDDAAAHIKRFNISRRDVIVVGGGGLLNAHDAWTNNIFSYCRAARCILWAPGHNLHFGRSVQQRPNVADIVSVARAVALRDFGINAPFSYTPMLDATCLHPLLDEPCTESRELGFYLHSKYRKEGHRYSRVAADIMYNDETSAEKVFGFLCSSKTIVTSSYHGALWATFMNKTVWTTQTFSEKFEMLPFRLPAWPDQPARAIDGIAVRDQCRHQNMQFYARFFKHAVENVLLGA